MNSKDEKKSEENIPGAVLDKPFEVATVTELRRWLKCRKASTKGLKCELVERCKIYSADPERQRVKIHEDEHPSTAQSTIHPNKENINGKLWTRSLTGLSQKFGEGKIYEHLGGTAEKHRVAGYKMFKCDKVENMLVSRNNSQQTSCFELNAIVAASYSKDRYKCNVKISNSSGKVTNAVCTCKSGAMGLCKHISAVLFQLNDYKQSGQEFIQEAIACTEKPTAWGVQKKRAPLVSKSFEELTFVKHTPEKAEKNIEFSKKRREYCSLPLDKQELSPIRLKRLANDMKSTRAMWSELILEHCGESENRSGKESTIVITSTNRANDLTGLIANGLSDSVDLQSKTFQSQIKKALDDMPPLTDEEISTIAEETRGQSFNDKWFFHRRDRITASIAGEIVHRRSSTPPDALVKRICQYTTPTIQPGPCKHGIELEAEARKKYVSVCQVSGKELTVDEVGLIIDSRYSWLAASVDGVIKITSPSKDTGILEIKCPYVDADSQEVENIPQTLAELCMTRKNFYLTVDEEGNISGLNKNHNYYFQVQTQMGILDLKWCDFMVYYKVKKTNICDTFVYHVQFDPVLYHNAIIPKLYDFYLKGVAPEIITRRVKRGERLYPNTSNYVYLLQTERQI